MVVKENIFCRIFTRLQVSVDALFCAIFLEVGEKYCMELRSASLYYDTLIRRLNKSMLYIFRSARQTASNGALVAVQY